MSQVRITSSSHLVNLLLSLFNSRSWKYTYAECVSLLSHFHLFMKTAQQMIQIKQAQTQWNMVYRVEIILIATNTWWQKVVIVTLDLVCSSQFMRQRVHFTPLKANHIKLSVLASIKCKFIGYLLLVISLPERKMEILTKMSKGLHHTFSGEIVEEIW